MKYKTKKYQPHKKYNPLNKQYIPLNKQQITRKSINHPKYLAKLLADISTEHNASSNIAKEKLIVLRPNHASPGDLIVNNISDVENILQMQQLNNKFKIFFTLDYMNYINLDIHKRRSAISRISLKYDKQPIIFEGYLAITISNGVLFDSYMLDTLKIITSTNANGNISSKKALFFPQDLPDNFTDKFDSKTPTRILSKIYEIINQAYTIIKYIAIILAHQKLYTSGNAFEIIKVQMRAYDDLSLILDGCKIKKDWQDTLVDRKMLNWLNSIFFRRILSNAYNTFNAKSRTNKPLDGIAGLSLYKRDLSTSYKRTEILPIYASNLERRDFNNKFILISSYYITKYIEKIDIDFQLIIKFLKKYGLEFEEFYSTIGTKPAFIFFAYDEPVNIQLIIQHYNTPAYCSNMLDSLDNINNKSNLLLLSKKIISK